MIARRILGALCALGFLCLVPAAPASAKSFEFPSVDIRIDVQPDGSFLVREQRTFDFHGSFHRAFVDIPTGPYGIDSVGVSENGRAYAAGLYGQELDGTYTFAKVPDFSTGNEQYDIRWFFDAVDQQRTFLITYRVTDAVVAHADIAELYWKFIGPGWDAGADHVTTVVTLPSAVPIGQLRAWGHGPLDGVVRIVDGRTVSWSVDHLAAHTFFEGRLTFPPSIVPGAQHEGDLRLPEVLSEEQRFADDANATRAQTRRLVEEGIGGTVVSLLLFLWLFFAFGREPSAPGMVQGMRVGEYLREPPSDDPPALVGYLMRFGNVEPADVTATILDLGRRGYLKITEQAKEEGLVFKHTAYEYTIATVKKDGADLAPHEKDVLDMLEEAGVYGPVTVSGMREWAAGNPSRMHDWFVGFQTDVNDIGRMRKLVEMRSWVLIVNGAAAILAGILAGAAAARSDSITLGAATLPFLAAQLALTPVLRRRTAKGASEFRAWAAFRRFLKDYSHLSEARPPEVALWEKYLIYAVPLGVADRVGAAMEVHAPEIVRSGVGWYAFPTSGSGFTSSLSSFTSTFTASAHAAFGVRSSGSGLGGGFSGGGGGAAAAVVVEEAGARANGPSAVN